MSRFALAVLAYVLAFAPETGIAQLAGDSVVTELTPVRRTTIVTADPEASLRFYRDLLGFTVEYDQIVTGGGTVALLAPGATEGRNIALRHGEKMGGSIGLFWTPASRPHCPAPSACCC